MVEIVDSSERLRNESYRHINEILAHAGFYLRTAGTATMIYKGTCPRKNYGLVGQWDEIHSSPVGELFLYWDNVEITITGDPKIFYDVAVELEKHNFRVKIEV
jgi:hypothetical protein